MWDASKCEQTHMMCGQHHTTWSGELKSPRRERKKPGRAHLTLRRDDRTLQGDHISSCAQLRRPHPHLMKLGPDHRSSRRHYKLQCRDHTC